MPMAPEPPCRARSARESRKPDLGARPTVQIADAASVLLRILPKAYPIPRMASGGAGHALIGAAIGFGIGATVGAIGSAHNGTSVGGGAIIGGVLLGFIGAAIGAASDGPHRFMHRRRLDPRTWPGDQDPWDEDDEESSRRSHPKSPQDHVELAVSSRPVPDKQPGDVDATVAPSRALSAVHKKYEICELSLFVGP
jgi:hypothetical protein